MESADYVNCPDQDRRNAKKLKENCCSAVGGSSVLWLVGVSFGLLCIVQATVNVYLRLDSAGYLSKYDNTSTNSSTVMSAEQIRDLLSDREQILKEKERLLQETERLLQETERLAEEKNNKQAINIDLINERKMLNEKLAQLHIQIQNLQIKVIVDQNSLCCPRGWQPYKFSCYQFSTQRNTFENARLDCERKSARLVILNDEMEERVVHSFGGGIQMWIGLTGQTNPSTHIWIWTWVDGSSESYSNWNELYMTIWKLVNTPSCVAMKSTPDLSNLWYASNCKEHYNWMCEKELTTSSTRP